MDRIFLINGENFLVEFSDNNKIYISDHSGRHYFGRWKFSRGNFHFRPYCYRFCVTSYFSDAAKEIIHHYLHMRNK